MARRPRWLVFADDTGDPGETGTPYFGYALLAVEHKDLSHLIETRARFRVSQSFFAESKKGRVGSAGFDRVISDVSRSVVAGRYRVAAVLIAKDRYSGPWLRPGFDQRGQALPADPTFLRNYLVRKALALLFDGYDESAIVELVLDRVAVSDEQIINLRDYLKGHFAQYEDGFAFPTVTHVTHADSVYVEGLQLADHVARFAYHVMSHPEDESAHRNASEFLRAQSVLTSRDFTMDERARDALTQQAKGRYT